MPRYGIVGPDGKTLTDVILIPERFGKGKGKEANAIKALEERASATADGSKVVEFAQLPEEKKGADRGLSRRKLEWDDVAKAPQRTIVEQV